MANFWALVKAIPALVSLIGDAADKIGEMWDSYKKKKRHGDIDEQSKNPDRQNAARNANDTFRKL